MAKLTKTNTPGIYRRHKGGCGGGRCDCAYVVTWRYRGKAMKETCWTFAEAREMKGQKEAGDRRPSARVDLVGYFDEWIEVYAGRTSAGFSETSRDEYRRVIKVYVLDEWKGWRLSDVEPADIRTLLKKVRAKGKSTSEIKKVRSTLSAMFATAAEDGVLRSNPAARVRIPAPLEDEGNDHVKAMNREEIGLMVAALPESWRLFFELLTHSGLRISEIVGLTWEHIELGDAPYMDVVEQVYRGKRRKLKSKAAKRKLPLSPAMRDRLLAHRRDTFTGPKAPVFLSPRRGSLSPPSFARSVLIPARESIGLEWVTFHTFRHTCASLLFEQGRNIKQVSEWLGHTDPSFTLRTYVHLMDEGVGDAAFFDEVVQMPRSNAEATGRSQTAESPGRTEVPDLAA
jgi:integrase